MAQVKINNKVAFEIYCGSESAMNHYAKRGVTALNRKTHKWQIINKKAKYKVVKDGIGALLYCDIDLRKEAEQKGLII